MTARNIGETRDAALDSADDVHDAARKAARALHGEDLVRALAAADDALRAAYDSAWDSYFAARDAAQATS